MKSNKMSEKNKNVILCVIYFIFFGALFAVGTFKDLEINIALYNPKSYFSYFWAYFGELPRYVCMGLIAGILLFTRHSLEECIEIISRVFPFIKPLNQKQIENKSYQRLNKLLNLVEIVGFSVLSFFGWKLEGDSLVKNITILAHGNNEDYFSWEAKYVIMSAIVSLVMTLIGFYFISKINKKTLNKLESLALVGFVLYYLYLIPNALKSIFTRVRFREMVAYSNGFLLDSGKSNGANQALTSEMINSTDFSSFTRWYQKGDNLGIYSHATSFPSGHTASVVFLFLGALVCEKIEKLKKYKTPFFIFAVVYTTTMAITRIVLGAHYLTDVAGAAIIMMVLLILTKQLLNIFESKKILPTRK